MCLKMSFEVKNLFTVNDKSLKFVIVINKSLCAPLVARHVQAEFYSLLLSSSISGFQAAVYAMLLLCVFLIALAELKAKSSLLNL